jgi:hypothetical protein
VFGLMANTDAVIRSRYLAVGPFTWPSHEALGRTCKSLRKSVRQALKGAGPKVRL